ncbi:MAG: ABC transporter ATP-binding protein [Candidatus Methylacidiphilales bacterium]|nr:ABC transporter ATP-binding protein [Candidatus Methylacidiphilales bacterium]
MATPTVSQPASPSSSAEPSLIIDVQGLGIVRTRNQILADVNWQVEAGQHWVILGANGSGKTSLLSALTGYFTPSTGRITLLGQTYGRSDWQKLRTRVGIVSSSVRQRIEDSEKAIEVVVSGKYAQLNYWGEVSDTDRAEAMVILERMEAGYLAEREWLFLSQGERQRVLIGRALMTTPPLLILDEPCAGLDPVARSHFLAFVARLAASPSSPTLVLVTHHVEEIEPCFTHVLVLRNGKVIARGPAVEHLDSATLSEAFGAEVTLRRSLGRYQLETLETIQRSGQADGQSGF